MHHARAAHAVVGTGTAIYALAGTGAGGKPVLPVERYDGTTWAVEATLPGDGLNAPAAAVVGDTIYLVGGFNTTTNVPTSQVLTYDCATKKWGEAAPLPAPRGGHAAVVLNGKVHVLGGGNSRSTIADHSVYDPATNTWTDLAPLPRSLGSPAAVAISGKIHLIGGRSGPSDFGDVHVYDPATNAWMPGPATEPRGTAGAVVYRGAIYLFGGESQAKQMSLGSVLRLDPTRGAWEEMAPMPTARNFARAVLFGDSVYIVGGSPTAGSSHSSAGSAVVERFHVGGAG
jgi:N-acetylneuraminic acid mutarotase